MSDFIQFARAHGVEIGDLQTGERIRRCATVEHPRSKNGAYWWDGSRGWVQAWDGDGQVHWFDDPQAKPWTDADKRAWAALRQSEAQAREAAYANAALRAGVMLRSTTPGQHGYLMRKGLPDVHGLRLPDGALFVPMRHLESNALQGGQVIRWLPDAMKWEKKMVAGMRAKGAVLRLGPKTAAETFLCEGYATGLSIELAGRLLRLSASVLVCFSAGNLQHVAPQLKGRATVFADNDESGAGEAAARSTGLPYVMSPILGEDANDFHVRAGLFQLGALLTSRYDAAARRWT